MYQDHRGGENLNIRKARIEHGTDRGYQQHMRFNDKPACQACKDAHAADLSRRRRGRHPRRVPTYDELLETARHQAAAAVVAAHPREFQTLHQAALSALLEKYPSRA